MSSILITITNKSHAEISGQSGWHSNFTVIATSLVCRCLTHKDLSKFRVVDRVYYEIYENLKTSTLRGSSYESIATFLSDKDLGSFMRVDTVTCRTLGTTAFLRKQKARLNRLSAWCDAQVQENAQWSGVLFGTKQVKRADSDVRFRIFGR